MSKISLITGANKGIGLETARQLGALGHTVLIGARDSKRGEEAAQTLVDEGFDAHFLRIDPTDATSIEAAAREVETKFGRLDVLINNAGTMSPADFAAPGSVEVDVFRETFDVNVFGLHAVTRAFWSLLEKSTPRVWSTFRARWAA
jgi:NAD(P)-dependent dehydrogenase (short-subunit alcohol dehydrogenase family)